MNMLNINFDKYLGVIKEAVCEVIGDYYEDFIEERASRTRYIYYNSLRAIRSYYEDLCNTKKRELCLEFFNKFGIDTSSFNNKRISERFPDDLKDKVLNLIGLWPFDVSEHTGIKAFLPSAKEDDPVVKRKRVELLNYLRGSSDINDENYKEFILTEEYHHLETQIKEYLSFYLVLKEKYDTYLTTISDYKDYIDANEERKSNTLAEGKEKMLEDISNIIPDSIKDFVRKTRECSNPLTVMFSNDELTSKFYIEYFGAEDEKELNSPETSSSSKNFIKEIRLMYFKALGIECNFIYPKDYDRVMNLPNIGELIPSQEVIEEIKRFRELRYEEALFNFYTKNEEFERYFDWLPCNDSVIDAIYSRLKENTVCVTRGSDDYGFLRFMFFSLKPNTLGKIDYMFLHEFIHAIESILIDDIHYCGFDELGDDAPDSTVNPKYRKYERLNETITDILAIEVRERLIDKGIYIAEDEREWVRDVYSFNTHSILKDMVKPLMDNYRDVVIHSRMSGDMETLYDVIGKENFEELNYLVNKVDDLISKGLIKKIDEKSNDDPMVIEYNDSLEQLKRVYERINKLNEVPKI